MCRNENNFSTHVVIKQQFFYCKQGHLGRRTRQLFSIDLYFLCIIFQKFKMIAIFYFSLPFMKSFISTVAT